MKSVLFVGAGRHQRRAIRYARERGLRVVAVDAKPDALGFEEADVGEAVDFTDVAGVTEVARRHGVDGALTVSADRAVPVVAAVTESLGLPTIGTATAHLMTHKIAMRRRLADAGVPQPRFAAVRTLREGKDALEETGLPAVLKPADSGGQRGVFRLESEDDLEAHLYEALHASPTQEAIVESFHEGLELNGIAVARGGDVRVLTLSDRLRPPGIGFGVGWIHVYPASIFGDAARGGGAGRGSFGTTRSGCATAIAFPQLLVSDDGVRVVEVAARIPGGQMADLVRHAVGVDLVEIALAAGARRGGAGRARRAGVLPAARDPLPDREAGPAADGEGRPDRPARPGARHGGGRAGGDLPAGRRDDPAGAARRRPAGIRDRDRGHVDRGARAGRGGGPAARGGGGGGMSVQPKVDL